MNEWQKYLIGFAEHASTKSKDTTKVGAVLVGPNKEVRLTGYNGFPVNVAENEERHERPLKYLFTIHAEQNIVSFAAKNGIHTEGCDIYVTHPPCAKCAASLIQASIKNIYVGSGTFTDTTTWKEDNRVARLMCEEAGVGFIKLGE